MYLRSIKKLGAEVYLNEPIGKDKDNNEISLIDILENDEKNIEIVNGNGDLNISPVTDYIEIEKPRPKITEEIVIPEEKKKI